MVLTKFKGIGAGFIPENFDQSLMDGVQTVSDEAFGEVQTFMRESGGISIGLSAGAAIVADKTYCSRHEPKGEYRCHRSRWGGKIPISFRFCK